MTKSSSGRLLFNILRPVVHLGRRIAHPTIPSTLGIAHVTYRDRKFALEYRHGSEGDPRAISQCFSHLQYDLPDGPLGIIVDTIYRNILASGRQPLIVDCGANIGSSVAWFSARYPEAHIVAIEPATENFALLTHNTQGLNVDLRKAGIAPTRGKAFIVDCGSDDGYRVLDQSLGDAIELITVDSILDEKPASLYTPFLLKVDIEGSEHKLFAANLSGIASFPLIVMEPHDWLFPGENISQEFFRFHVDHAREIFLKHENVASIDLHHPLAQPKDSTAPTTPPVKR